jgi:SAM-dependent MidA family methyltransferase
MADHPGATGRCRGVTPLGARLAERIRAEGPIGLDTYIEVALGDPVHGYYRTRDPLGAAGDFTTAPEISQVFGEILGLWCVDAWQRLGEPPEALLVELGPGRGTLMTDMLRAIRIVERARAALSVHLVETSPVLRARQRSVLGTEDVTWHESLDTVPDRPMILVANEFFDALPIRQWVRRRGSWRERFIDLDSAGNFAPVDGPIGTPMRAPAAAEEGEIFETCAIGLSIAAAMGARIRARSGAAIIIDYGHPQTHFGDTLQALKAHQPVSPFGDPGECDITAHVDFEALGEALGLPGVSVEPLVTQGAFLIAHGAALREAALVRGKSEAAATAIRLGIRRLIDPSSMGRLFKVLIARSPGSGVLPT